ncbi:hypothetical protein [Sulfuricurvum sp.]|uniref:hypothetical protein n=1 Tax=Sulfuricurvum sp. TaxID=2025608 RepID=UPI0026130770|nr:hypothetical protein [Sulfuricurvum sp.]MDD2780631.1 hypothetical protein [Sulfuricurvum sp.]
MVCAPLKTNYVGYKESVQNRSVKTEKSFNSLVKDIQVVYEKLFGYSSVTTINANVPKMMVFTKAETPLKLDHWEITFSIDFKLKEGFANEFKLHKYSYVMKSDSDTRYFRFEGTDEGEKACHPYYHLHIKEDGAPRIATHVVTPYDFLVFIADMSGSCEALQ